MHGDDTNPRRRIVASAVLLAGFAVAGAALIAVTWHFSAERIAENQRHYMLSSLHEVVPSQRIDNNLFADTLTVDDSPLLGQSEPVTVYRGTWQGEPVAVVVPVIAPDGYNGRIELLVGILVDGTVSGVRVIEHRETPGLGDAIEARRSDWIEDFRGRSLGDPPDERWRVKRDGGEFDQFTGATITPRAVVRAVRRALVYFESNREALFADLPEPPPAADAVERDTP